MAFRNLYLRDANVLLQHNAVLQMFYSPNDDRWKAAHRRVPG